jgi:hypothetical protein
MTGTRETPRQVWIHRRHLNPTLQSHITQHRMR